MKVLAIDTSTRVASVAVVDGDVTLAQTVDDSGDQSDRLIGEIDDILREAALPIESVDAIAVGAGPGSFTGLRIGMATAKGLAFALDKPLWAVSSLAALASQAVLSADARHIAAVVDARRKEIFVGLFVASTLEAVGGEAVMAPAELSAALERLGAEPSTTVIVGDAARLYPEAVASCGRIDDKTIRPSARAVARLAMSTHRGDVRATATPVYIRPSEAEIRFPNGNPGGTFAPPEKK